MSRDWFAGVLAALALCLAPLAATPATHGADDATPASDVVSAARGYRASLDHLLPFREHAVTRARETAFAHRQLLADGVPSTYFVIGSRCSPEVFVVEPTHAWHLHHPALAWRLHAPGLGRVLGQR
jgi:hypothetical protein